MRIRQIRLCPRREEYKESRSIKSFLTLALDGVSGQHLAQEALTQGKKPSVPAEYRDGVGLKACLGVLEKRKLSDPFRQSNPGSFSP